MYLEKFLLSGQNDPQLYPFLCHTFESLLSLIQRDINELSFNEVQEIQKKLLKYFSCFVKVTIGSVWDMRNVFRPQEGAHIVLLRTTALCGGARDKSVFGIEMRKVIRYILIKYRCKFEFKSILIKDIFNETRIVPDFVQQNKMPHF